MTELVHKNVSCGTIQNAHCSMHRARADACCSLSQHGPHRTITQLKEPGLSRLQVAHQNRSKEYFSPLFTPDSRQLRPATHLMKHAAWLCHFGAEYGTAAPGLQEQGASTQQAQASPAQPCAPAVIQHAAADFQTDSATVGQNTRWGLHLYCKTAASSSSQAWSIACSWMRAALLVLAAVSTWFPSTLHPEPSKHRVLGRDTSVPQDSAAFGKLGLGCWQNISCREPAAQVDSAHPVQSLQAQVIAAAGNSCGQPAECGVRQASRQQLPCHAGHAAGGPALDPPAGHG